MCCVPFDVAGVELSERRFGYEVERRSLFDSCSFTQRFAYVLSLSGQFLSVEIQARAHYPAAATRPRRRGDRMRRREFIAGLGSAVASWPLATRAQQPKMPVVGLLNLGSPAANARSAVALRQGLAAAGFLEG